MPQLNTSLTPSFVQYPAPLPCPTLTASSFLKNRPKLGRGLCFGPREESEPRGDANKVIEWWLKSFIEHLKKESRNLKRSARVGREVHVPFDGSEMCAGGTRVLKGGKWRGREGSLG